MDLKTMIKQDAQRVRRRIAALRAAENESFLVGETKCLGDQALPVLVSPAPAGRTLIAVGVGEVPPLAQDLACGVFRGDQLIAVARTGGAGMFGVTLEQGAYRLRFVNSVRDELDKQILRRLGDRRAREQLDAADGHDADDGSVTLSAYAVSRPRPDVWRAAEDSARYALCASSTEVRPPRILPPNEATIDEEEGLIRVRTRCDQHGRVWVPELAEQHEDPVIPYAFVLVEARESSTDHVLGHKLVPLPLYHGPQGKYRSAVIPLRDIVSDAGQQVVSDVYLASARNLPKFREYRDELARLRDSPEVAYERELGDNLTALEKELAERTECDQESTQT